MRQLPESSKRKPPVLEVEGCQLVAQRAKRASIVAAATLAASVAQHRGTLSVYTSALPCSFPTPCNPPISSTSENLGDCDEV
ncbi:hypothetical protein L1987_49155 [Smallanthus sonchifolius]|uniref:Uncharacterized protein n=1 Tax=Smallanthus sonchifolius TaxID=185202 RepID=A0ACB9FV09_9ASTR|nr:hypothetical protein L1987_49155 [Smallanthus sonchifolius]